MVLFEPGPVCGYTKPSGLRCVVIENMVALYLRKESTNLAEFSADMTDILDSLIQCSKKKMFNFTQEYRLFSSLHDPPLIWSFLCSSCSKSPGLWPVQVAIQSLSEKSVTCESPALSQSILCSSSTYQQRGFGTWLKPSETYFAHLWNRKILKGIQEKCNQKISWFAAKKHFKALREKSFQKLYWKCMKNIHRF